MLMDRRSFIKDAAALAAGAWQGAGSESLMRAPNAATVLVDAALEESAAFASDAISAGARLANVGGDVGALWYSRLARTRGRIVGVLRPSDAFVLARLAKRAGRTVAERPVLARTVELAIDDAHAAERLLPVSSGTPRPAARIADAGAAAR